MRCRVFITQHAMKKWRERVSFRGSPKTIAGWVRRRLLNQLALGMKANNRGAFELELCRGLVAVLIPDGAGWVVLTFLPSMPPEKMKLPG